MEETVNIKNYTKRNRNKKNCYKSTKSGNYVTIHSRENKFSQVERKENRTLTETTRHEHYLVLAFVTTPPPQTETILN